MWVFWMCCLEGFWEFWVCWMWMLVRWSFCGSCLNWCYFEVVVSGYGWVGMFVLVIYLGMGVWWCCFGYVVVMNGCCRFCLLDRMVVSSCIEDVVYLWVVGVMDMVWECECSGIDWFMVGLLMGLERWLMMVMYVCVCEWVSDWCVVEGLSWIWCVFGVV